jgi:hypothetical protein
LRKGRAEAKMGEKRNIDWGFDILMFTVSAIGVAAGFGALWDWLHA